MAIDLHQLPAVIRSVVTERNISVYRLAAQSGLSINTLRNLPTGQWDPLWSTLAKVVATLAEHYQVDVLQRCAQMGPGSPMSQTTRPASTTHITAQCDLSVEPGR